MNPWEPPSEEPEGSGRPMSLFAAGLWMTGAQLVGLWFTFLVVGLSESAAHDPVVRVFCQVVGYLLVLYFMLRVHAPESPIREFVAMTSPRAAFYPIAIVVGVASVFPSEWLYEQILHIHPLDEDGSRLVDVFYGLSFSHRIAVAVAASVGGPIVEELIFRGAAFTQPLERHRPRAMVALTAVFFALIHLDPQSFVPLVGMGLILGHLRWASGSVVPPILLHAAFNATSFVDMMRYDTRPETTPLPWAWALAGAAVTAIGLLLAHRMRAREPS